MVDVQIIHFLVDTSLVVMETWGGGNTAGNGSILEDLSLHLISTIE